MAPSRHGLSPEFYSFHQRLTRTEPDEQSRWNKSLEADVRTAVSPMIWTSEFPSHNAPDRSAGVRLLHTVMQECWPLASQHDQAREAIGLCTTATRGLMFLEQFDRDCMNVCAQTLAIAMFSRSGPSHPILSESVRDIAQSLTGIMTTDLRKAFIGLFSRILGMPPSARARVEQLNRHIGADRQAEFVDAGMPPAPLPVATGTWPATVLEMADVEWVGALLGAGIFSEGWTPAMARRGASPTATTQSESLHSSPIGRVLKN